MEYLRELREGKMRQLEAFKEIYPEDEKALKYALRICGPKCVNFEIEAFKKEEKRCFENCLWKFGQVLSHED